MSRPNRSAIAVTKAPDARANARAGMQALMRLEAITGIPGFPARSFIKKGVDEQPSDGEWHDTQDGVWRWKGDTSSDEIVGHYFVYPIYHDLVADDSEKVALRGVIDRITNHILDTGITSSTWMASRRAGAGGRRTRSGKTRTKPGCARCTCVSHLQVAIHSRARRRIARSIRRRTPI